MGTAEDLNRGDSALKILIVEDNPRDLKLMLTVLERSGYRVVSDSVDTAADFQEHLQRNDYDVIISDYNLRDWTAIDVLEIVNTTKKDVPVIVASGSLGDEAAVEVIKKGATDYVLKDRMARLPSAIERTLEEKALREQRRRAEDQVRAQLDRLAALRTIDIAITSSLDLRLTLSVFLDQVTTQLRIDAADVLLLKPHTRILEYATGRGFRSSRNVSSRMNLGEDPAGRAVLERRVIKISSLEMALSRLMEASLLVNEEFVSYFAVPLIAKGQVNGVLEIWHRAPLDPSPDWLEFLDALTGQAAIAVDNAMLYQQLQTSNEELLLSYDTTLDGWVKALDMRDKETEGHTRRVTEMTMQLASHCRIDDGELVHIRRGALLHDIGKMAIPDSILHKPGPLTSEEWAIMRKHTVYAYEWLSPIPYLRPALYIPYCHHEKWDGSGYPRGLKDKDIPFPARLFSVVDVWDALRSDRPYRAAWPEEKVREYIANRSGEDFDPDVVEIFLKTFKPCEREGDHCDAIAGDSSWSV